MQVAASRNSVSAKIFGRARLLLTVVSAGFTPFSASAQAGDVAPPRLVVFITIDAMRADYLPRFAQQLTGGLGRLYRGGAVFTNGFQDHAITATAPGHSATMSGRFPVHTGISANSAGVNDTTVTLVGAAGPGASPFRFQGTMLTDWLIEGFAHARAVGVEEGSRRNSANWTIEAAHILVRWQWDIHDEHLLRPHSPDWARAFNGQRLAQGYAGQAWRPLLPGTAYSEPDSVAIESGGTGFVFPHIESTSPDTAARQRPEFPWMDELTLEKLDGHVLRNATR